MDARLTTLWGNMPQERVAKVMGLSRDAIRKRAKELQLPKRKHGLAYEPDQLDWIDIATRCAIEAGVDPVHVLSGDKKRVIAKVRWRAWSETLQAFPSCSIAGLGRVSGFNHTSILHGLCRLSGASLATVRASRCVGRRARLGGVVAASVERRAA